MKIISLRFKNINSLAGENEIDFTNPVFTQEGLFAITGKTGAGKVLF
jgi:exonuclease SbcC